MLNVLGVLQEWSKMLKDLHPWLGLGGEISNLYFPKGFCRPSSLSPRYFKLVCLATAWKLRARIKVNPANNSELHILIFSEEFALSLFIIMTKSRGSHSYPSQHMHNTESLYFSFSSAKGSNSKLLIQITKEYDIK